MAKRSSSCSGACRPRPAGARARRWRSSSSRKPASTASGIHRLLVQNGITSHVVDAASIAVNRRHRRAKTDKIDGVKLLRTLMAWMRGERQVCSMVQPPSPENEDRRRLARERAQLLKERVQHTNRIKGLLSGQGIPDYDPLHRDRRGRLVALTTGDGHS